MSAFERRNLNFTDFTEDNYSTSDTFIEHPLSPKGSLDNKENISDDLWLYKLDVLKEKV